MLRKHGVVGKFVEFYGDGLIHYRWRIAPPLPICRQNMVPLWLLPNRCCHPRLHAFKRAREDQVELVEKYAKAQRMWRNRAMNQFLPVC